MQQILNFLLSFFILVTQSYAADANKYCISKDGIGVGGKDLVSFFHANGSPPKDGIKKFRLKFDGVIYQFSNNKNKNLFRENPKKYIPKYGGFCATALAYKTKICPNYNYYLIENGALYLFEVKGFSNGKSLWVKDKERLKPIAEKFYTKSIKKK